MKKGNLVLSRKKGESIIIRIPASKVEREIVITVIEIKEGRAKIMTTADKDVKLNRKEIQDQKDTEASENAKTV